MRTIVIKEFETELVNTDFILDLTKQEIKDCLGCWTCWVKKPGHCVHHDLDAFYCAFYRSDRAIFLIQPAFGFITGNLKTMLDRMLPGFMPYI